MLLGFSSRYEKVYQGLALDLIAETVKEALDMAKLEPKDIDGVITTWLPWIFDGTLAIGFPENYISEYLGIRPKFTDLVQYGGASALEMFYRAYKAVKSGEADRVLCVIGGKGTLMKKQLREGGLERFSEVELLNILRNNPFDEFIRVYQEMDPISFYAMVAARHSKLYGTTDEQRALLAVQQRYNANSNERALFRGPLTVKDIINSRVVSTPLHLLEITYPIDGVLAFIVGKGNSQLRSMDVISYGDAIWPEFFAERDVDIVYTPTIESAKKIDFNLNKIDAFEIYDAFTIMVLTELEDLGLTEKGKIGKFVEENDLTIKGSIPVNTGGGSLNMGQPAYMSGIIILEEAFLQFNNMAKGHQVSGADYILVNGLGGWNTHATTLVIGEKK
ncbi:thiolase family protein [Saccharolobus islandicus]|uniref:Acetyl-CoA acetyltransferase n=3 Tax=Saccharolobus islandicus TaxID=43080 RepID=C4KFU6_SACI6|nr:thiolase family protein [Sulfolobus islandicus]ACP37624.1 acetyl-CoA acetyltransferase [Sulfolobus islandicus M.14.25]ACP54766.1 acetyl-CoA acetyltransferase [Sulfolobus islandicus M.16.27]ACR41460.1 acetyl-CoA acetyltransferase [Sulfolobus islandicus M.16.4]